MTSDDPQATSRDGDGVGIDDLCRELSIAHERREECRLALKDAEEEFDRVETALAIRLDRDGTKDLLYDRWVLTPKHTVSWKTLEDRKLDALEIIRQGVPSLVRESVNASSLNAYLRKEEDRLEAEAPPWWATLKAMLERKESIGLSMRKR